MADSISCDGLGLMFVWLAFGMMCGVPMVLVRTVIICMSVVALVNLLLVVVMSVSAITLTVMVFTMAMIIAVLAVVTVRTVAVIVAVSAMFITVSAVSTVRERRFVEARFREVGDGWVGVELC